MTRLIVFYINPGLFSIQSYVRDRLQRERHEQDCFDGYARRPVLTMLRYIYFGKLTFSDYPEDEILEQLRLANYYQVEDLVESIISYILSTLSVDNVCDCLKISSRLSLPKLELDCLRFIDDNAAEFINHASFLGLQQVCPSFLLSLVEFPSFFFSLPVP